MNSNKPISLLWDADGSPDSVVALLYFIQHPAFKVEAATVSCGQAKPDIFIQKLSRMFAQIDKTAIPFSAGRSTPLSGDNAFPPPWREGTNTFWGLELPAIGIQPYPKPAVDLILDTLHSAQDPIIVFISGPQTNLAEVLKREPHIRGKIASVHIMGGALDVPGNMHSEWPDSDNIVSEWNLWVDPLAAREVFRSGLELFLTPLDATNQVVWTRQDAQDWIHTGTPTGILSGKILEWFLNNLSLEGFYFWDLVTAVNLTDPHLSRKKEAHVQILVEPELEQGRTVLSPNLSSNTTVFLQPDGKKMKSKVAKVFGFRS